MTGEVNEFGEPLVVLSVLDSGGNPTAVGTVVDTGFNGCLTLPPVAVAALGLRKRGRSHAYLADGTGHEFDVYEATVEWHGRPRRVEVDEVDAEPLLGMALLQGSDLHIRVAEGGAVTITESPNP